MTTESFSNCSGEYPKFADLQVDHVTSTSALIGWDYLDDGANHKLGIRLDYRPTDRTESTSKYFTDYLRRKSAVLCPLLPATDYVVFLKFCRQQCQTSNDTQIMFSTTLPEIKTMPGISWFEFCLTMMIVCLWLWTILHFLRMCNRLAFLDFFSKYPNVTPQFEGARLITSGELIERMSYRSSFSRQCSYASIAKKFGAVPDVYLNSKHPLTWGSELVIGSESSEKRRTFRKCMSLDRRSTAVGTGTPPRPTPTTFSPSGDARRARFARQKAFHVTIGSDCDSLSAWSRQASSDGPKIPSIEETEEDTNSGTPYGSPGGRKSSSSSRKMLSRASTVAHSSYSYEPVEFFLSKPQQEERRRMSAVSEERFSVEETGKRRRSSANQLIVPRITVSRQHINTSPADL